MRTFFKYFFWITTVLIMAMIFCFSSQVAEESQKTSESLTEKVLMSFDFFKNLPKEEQTEIVEGVQFTVRKGAHFSAYALLGVSSLSALWLTFKFNKKWLWAFLICFIYAISDEVHQYFVPGRSMEARDVLIDSSGAIIGILITVGIIAIYRKKKQKST